ncbi:ImmA/IrrE family metallo-endopeptidase [Mucilaginibacter ginsenosidivorans]|uniref:ImmA/IrrE family metallo-endopeptidase n=1 Tax=Mucilaginibacter ginsenosidivorans TaxID=398053 RepID=A0A5B8UW12_9SPHI|nr:ImmA/IrrE family metallo-endopeptidase [Mucilaginibacter ginsenosidivorans]QEC62521.1 ImmA/IrrE family metallo-endopeptidase [Mucilaginibacter ginsenosidivorans]
MNIGITPNLKIVDWAIGRAGYNTDEFMLKFPVFAGWLQGDKLPTQKQLEDFSQKVHLPFGYLFLEQPPQEKLAFPFFRTGNTTTFQVSLNLYDTILLMQKRQDWLVEYLKENNAPQVPFVGKFAQINDPEIIVADIRKTLGLEPEWASLHKKNEEALDHLSSRVEEAGIFLSFNSVVENSNKRGIAVEECRGFVLVNTYAPFLFVNAADSKAAQIFTIMHELAHIWLGKSAGFDMQQLLPADDPIEQLCDQVAAELLVPGVSFSRKWEELKDIPKLAAYFKVSRIVIARRALDHQKITKKEFFGWYNHYKVKLQEQKEKASGGDFYLTQKKRLGLRFAGLVNQAVKETQLLYRDAYKLTGLKGDTYQHFMNNNF